MARKQFRPQEGGNSLIEQVIAAPLEAVARANSNMAHEQLAFLLKYCFEEKPDGNYIPRMINLTVTRQEVVHGDNDNIDIISLESTINLPILTIVPISSLAVEKMEINFDLEVTSMETFSSDSQSDANKNKAPGSGKQNKGVALRGKIGSQRSNKTSSNRKEQNKSNLEIKITAGPLPLPSGVLTMIDSFNKQIVPVDIKPSDNKPAPSPSTDPTKT